MLRAALFTLVGIAFLAHWALTDPSHHESASQHHWDHVLGFSAAILALAVALPMFARMAGGQAAFRVSLVGATGAALGSLANVVEDGLRQDWAFYAFVLSTAILVVSLLALTTVVALNGRGRRRLLALIPGLTLAAIVFYVVGGGVLMALTWLAAAALALRRDARPRGALRAR